VIFRIGDLFGRQAKPVAITSVLDPHITPIPISSMDDILEQ
jgi:hypothetical protein